MMFRPVTAFVLVGTAGLGGSARLPATPAQTAAPQEMRVPVVFSEGQATDPQDRGRPVVLIAAALGVPADVFRDAFRHVRPAQVGTRPEPGQVRDNKAALLNALAKYGVTNERLDTVSNYYRYVRSRGESWPAKPASAYAVVQNGVVTRFVVTDGGSGYSSAPVVTVPGVNGAGAAAATAKVTLLFGKTLETNGAIASLTPVK